MKKLPAGEIIVKVTIEEFKYDYADSVKIAELKYTHLYSDKKIGAYKPCKDSPLYGINTLGDMRNFMKKHGITKTMNALKALYGVGQYTADAIISHCVAKAVVKRTSY